MLGHAHAGLGWVIGVLPPGSDRRLRTWCVAAAVLPDIDAIAYLFGVDAYLRWHHTFGHNVFLGMLTVIAAVLHHGARPVRQRILAGTLVGLCFASHILTDMKMSGYDVYVLWPVSRQPFAFHPMWPLGHPFNQWIVLVLAMAAVMIPFWKPVTPLEILSPRLDRIVLNFFRKKTMACATCGSSCNTPCDTCARPVCQRHGRISWRFRVACPACFSVSA